MKPSLILAAACAVLALTVGVTTASAAGEIHPGVQLFTNGAQCTANFIYTAGGNTYIGQAAHCSGTGEATDTDGCTSASLPIGTPVEVTGATKPGTLVYNSWITMQAKGETNPDTCAYNDLALVKLDPADVGRVDPTVPGWGGPTGLAEAPSNAGDDVFTYGNSELRGGITTLSPKQGKVVQPEGNGWSRTVYTASPGVPGDSGSGFLDASGNAIGVLSTVAIAPLAGSNGVGDLAKEVAYAQANGVPGLAVTRGTKPFSGSLATAIRGA